MKRKYLVQFRVCIEYPAGIQYLFRAVWMPFVPFPKLGCKFEGMAGVYPVADVSFDTETGEIHADVACTVPDLDAGREARNDFKVWGWKDVR